MIAHRGCAADGQKPAQARCESALRVHRPPQGCVDVAKRKGCVRLDQMQRQTQSDDPASEGRGERVAGGKSVPGLEATAQVRNFNRGTDGEVSPGVQR